jgi:hypothetical protein
VKPWLLLNELKIEVAKMKKGMDLQDDQMKIMQEEIDDLKQAARANTLKIDGFPESNGSENIKEVVCNFMNEKLNIPMFHWEIDSCFRVGKKVPDDEKPRRIVMQLLSQEKRRRILSEKKKLRNIKAADGKKELPIYINEDIIPKTAEIAQAARLAVKNGTLNHTWIMNGKVHVKKGQDADMVVIKSMSILNELIKQK